MQEHLVGKHPYGKLRIFRGADGSAVIREKGAYGNHMVEVGNMTGEVEVASLGTEVSTSKNAVNALSAGFGLGTAANQLNQAAQLATGTFAVEYGNAWCHPQQCDWISAQ